MSRFQFELASAADDQELCALLRSTPMDGDVQVAFSREPSFFAAAAVEGHEHATIVCRDSWANHRIVGMGTRSIQSRWVNGQLMEVGYLSGLRIDPQYRSIGLLARGYQLLAQLHRQRPLALYLTTIAQQNVAALRLLTSGRAGLPTYRRVDDYLSVAIPIPRRRASGRRRQADRQGLEIRSADPRQLDEILEFWRRWGSERQFFPAYDRCAFDAATGVLRGLPLEDLLVARRDGRIVGTLGLWDQLSFRRVVICGYQGPLARWRRWYNLWSRVRGYHELPDTGRPLRTLFAATPVVERHDPNCLCVLLQRLKEMACDRGASHLMIGLSRQDPLSAVLRSIRAIAYRTHLFCVDWDRDGAALPRLDGRPCYLELGGL